jgi:hypothetical protein
MTQTRPAPCTQWLAWLGADVVKIESPAATLVEASPPADPTQFPQPQRQQARHRLPRACAGGENAEPRRALRWRTTAPASSGVDLGPGTARPQPGLITGASRASASAGHTPRSTHTTAGRRRRARHRLPDGLPITLGRPSPTAARACRSPPPCSASAPARQPLRHRCRRRLRRSPPLGLAPGHRPRRAGLDQGNPPT